MIHCTCAAVYELKTMVGKDRQDACEGDSGDSFVIIEIIFFILLNKLRKALLCILTMSWILVQNRTDPVYSGSLACSSKEKKGLSTPLLMKYVYCLLSFLFHKKKKQASCTLSLHDDIAHPPAFTATCPGQWVFQRRWDKGSWNVFLFFLNFHFQPPVFLWVNVLNSSLIQQD